MIKVHAMADGVILIEWRGCFGACRSSCLSRAVAGDRAVSWWVSHNVCGWIGAMLLGHVDVMREESAIECGAADPENLRGLCPISLSLLECLEQLGFWFCVVRVLGG